MAATGKPAAGCRSVRLSKEAVTVNDRLIRNGTVINVYSGELLPGNVAIADGRITYVGPSEPAAAL